MVDGVSPVFALEQKKLFDEGISKNTSHIHIPEMKVKINKIGDSETS
jgi:hypothetical protein